MNGTDEHEHQTPTTDDEHRLDPREAAILLDQATRQAHREFSYRPPLLTSIRAVVVLLGYGALWWSVRGQHPYKGPSRGVILVLYAAVIFVIVVSALALRRATTGVTGPSRRQEGALGVAFVTAFIATAVFQGALHYVGVGPVVVYGVFPAAAPLLVVGATLGGMAAAQENWRLLATAIALIALGTGSVFAGPIGVWGVIAIGGCVLLLGYAVAQVRERYRPVIVRA
jgi:hypothetical protein